MRFDSTNLVSMISANPALSSPVAMDPWLSNGGECQSVKTTKFEDDFVPCDKLPDSAEYLATLEKKLAKLKERQSKKDLVESLEETRKSCMLRLVSEGISITSVEEDLDLDTPINNSHASNTLLRHIAPERQALTLGELVELLKADQLSEKLAEESNLEENVESSPTYCIVTGASQGIGSKIAVEFSQKFGKGSVMLLLARSLSGLEETKNLVLKKNPDISVIIHSVDLSKANEDEFSSIIKKSLTDSGKDSSAFGLSVLVHNAGSVGDLKEFCSDMSNVSKIQEYFSLNLFSVMCLTSVFLKNFTENVKSRLIINITSLCGIQPFKNLGYYCTGKAAREMYFKVLAAEDSNLRVLSYSPGPVNTDMISQVMNNVRDSETKTMFLDMKKNDSILSTDQTVNRLISILDKNEYESGCRIDYFDITD